MDPLRLLTDTLRDRYDVEREVGAGGMATVYRARDLRHDRLVALKVLRPELGAVLGAERFLAEIKVTANLQHPNILPLFDSGEAEGLLYYVMPFVDGETLRARLDRERQLPIDEAIAITRAIANALDYAHAANVIHRDLKPENILFQAGQPVLADFGIALAVANAGGARITQTGLSLGTPQYMSPEQATGDRVIDGRTDLYSLGAVLYEMLTGEPPHSGTTAQAIIARVLTDKPRSARASRDTIPPHVEAALDRVLAKLPADRFSSGREFAQALGAGFSTTGVGAVSPAAQDIRFSFSISKGALVRTAKWTALVAAAAAGVGGWVRPRAADVREPRMRIVLEVPDSLAPSSSLGQASLVISPDGSEIIYPSVLNGGTLLRRRFDDFAVVEVPDARGAANPRYSPDGRSLAIEAGLRLLTVPLGGGPSTRIADTANRNSWGAGGSIVFGRNGVLWTVTEAGGLATRLTALDSAAGETSHTWPHVLPGGEAALFEIGFRGKPIDEDEIAVVRLRDGRITRLGLRGNNPRFVSTGHLLFARQDGTVAAIEFDPRSLKARGQPVTVLDNVVVKSGGAAMYSVSDNGTLVYIDGSTDFAFARVDGRGSAQQMTTHRGQFLHPRLSPRGDQLVFAIVDRGRADIWTMTLRSGQVVRLTRDGESYQPEWASGGDEIAWIYQDSTRDVIHVQAADGSGTPRVITPLDADIIELAVTRSGDSAVVVGGTSGRRRFTMSSLRSDAPGRELLSASITTLAPQFSSDGRWLVYTSEEAGRLEVFIASVQNPANRFQVTTEGGLEPSWSADGRAVFYRSGGFMARAAVSLTPRFEVTERTSLFPAGVYGTTTLGRDYDVDRRTGDMIMRVRNIGERERIIVVTRWLDELRERMESVARR